MSTITPQELQLLETRPQRTKLWLSIYQPTTILSGLVNDAGIGRKERSITYDNSVGDFNDVESGMVMYIGTSAGDDDIGRIRVKSATNTVITVAENADVDWENNQHLTIVNFFEITAIYPRIIQKPLDPLDVIFYKDYNVAYTNQNTVLGSFISMGPHRAAFLEDGGTVDIYWSASGTSQVNDLALDYDWEFGGAPSGTSDVHTPGWVTYDTAGHYTTKFTTSRPLADDVSYRHVSIYDRPEDGTNVPILSWELKNLSGSRDKGGYSGTIRIRTDVEETIVRDGALIVLFADDWYDHTKQSIGGNAINAQSIVFVGYILDGTIEYNYRDGFVEFEIGSPTEVMKNVEGFIISVESKVLPTTWYELISMNCERALYHYLRWHTTAMLCNDFEFTCDDQAIQYNDTDRRSMYYAVNTFLESTLVGNTVSDRQGKTWLEIDAKGVDDAVNNISTSDLEISKYAWMHSPIIIERQRNTVSYLEIGGISYNGPALNTFDALLSMAPGDAPAYGGSALYRQGLALESQAQLNTLAGNIFAWDNSRYPSMTIKLTGNFRNFDIAPQEILSVTVEDEDTPRKITFSDKAFIVQDMFFENMAANQVLLSTINTAEVTQGIVGETLIIPIAPPTDAGTGTGSEGGGFDIPPFEFPPIDIGTLGTLFTLYDEGSLVGVINSLNAVGTGIEATIDGTVGTLTITCGGICGTSDAVQLTSTQLVTGLTNGIKKVLRFGNEDNTGYDFISYPDCKVEILVGGIHSVRFDVRSAVLLTSPVTDDSTYRVDYYIETYSAAHALLSSEVYVGVTYDAGSDDGINYFGEGTVSRMVSAAAGDYIQISALLTATGTLGVVNTEPLQLSIYKI